MAKAEKRKPAGMLKPVLAAVATAMSAAAGGAWWLHETSQVQAIRQHDVEVRVGRLEQERPKSLDKIHAKLDRIELDIREVMIAVGAEKAARKALSKRDDD